MLFTAYSLVSRPKLVEQMNLKLYVIIVVRFQTLKVSYVIDSCQESILYKQTISNIESKECRSVYFNKILREKFFLIYGSIILLRSR